MLDQEGKEGHSESGFTNQKSVNKLVIIETFEILETKSRKCSENQKNSVVTLNCGGLRRPKE